MNYCTYNKHSTDWKLLWLLAVTILFAACLMWFSLSQPVRTITWQQLAKTEFDVTFVQDENGKEQLAIDISTPEQLAGVFSQKQKTYNLYDSSKNATTGKQSKKYLAKNLSQKSLNKYYISTYSSINDIFLKDDTTNPIILYRLTNDINLNSTAANWDPYGVNLGSNEILDGQGFAIKNLNITAKRDHVGLIAGNWGTIKNLNLVNVQISINDSFANVRVGPICALNQGAEVSNCSVSINKISIKSTSGFYGEIGGIVGNNSGGTVQNCETTMANNFSGIQTGQHVGGIVGYSTKLVMQDSNTTIKSKILNCKNNLNISFVNANVSLLNVGGIVGYAGNTDVAYCGNFGIIRSSDGKRRCIGGVVGYAYQSNIFECKNNESITAGSNESENFYIGGICGVASEGVSIYYCLNKGEVSATSPRDKNLTTVVLNGCPSSKVLEGNPATEIKTDSELYTIEYNHYCGGILGGSMDENKMPLIYGCYSSTDCLAENDKALISTSLVAVISSGQLTINHYIPLIFRHNSVCPMNYSNNGILNYGTNLSTINETYVCYKYLDINGKEQWVNSELSRDRIYVTYGDEAVFEHTFRIGDRTELPIKFYGDYNGKENYLTIESNINEDWSIDVPYQSSYTVPDKYFKSSRDSRITTNRDSFLLNYGDKFLSIGSSGIDLKCFYWEYSFDQNEDKVDLIN